MNENTYWNNRGRYTKEHDFLWQFIPFAGACENRRLEAVRCAAALYYDFYNNGCCNYVPNYVRHWEYLYAHQEIIVERGITLDGFQRLNKLIKETQYVLILDADDGRRFPPNDCKDEMAALLEQLADSVILWAYELYG